MNIKKEVKKNLSKKRYKHTISVAKTAKKLSKVYNINIKKSYIASLLHDFTKEYDLVKQENIINKHFKEEEVYDIKPAWHSYTASIIVEEKFNILDKDILDAIKYHTLGHFKMNDIAKVVFIADYIEPKRKHIDIDYFKSLIGKISLDELLLIVLEQKINFLKSKNKYIPNQTLELEKTLKNL